MLTDMHVLESGDLILLDVPDDQVAPTLARLDQFLFSEDVQLASLAADLATVWTHGPAAAAALRQAIGGADDLGAWPSYRVGKGTFADAPVVIARIDQLGVPGFCAYIAPAAQGSLEGVLEAQGVRRVAPAAVDAARIAAGYPLFGMDMTTDTIPLEAGIDGRGISLTKGCYVGQEVIIRVLHRGHGRVARRLVGLRAERSVSAGAKLLSGDRAIGFFTSAATSPANGHVALGYVPRDFVAPGTQVAVASDAGPVGATVGQTAR
jgi:folate-binding protein YgfZ